jgi:hypothetical protein
MIFNSDLQISLDFMLEFDAVYSPLNNSIELAIPIIVTPHTKISPFYLLVTMRSGLSIYLRKLVNTCYDSRICANASTSSITSITWSVRIDARLFTSQWVYSSMVVSSFLRFFFSSGEHFCFFYACEFSSSKSCTLLSIAVISTLKSR